VSLTSTLFSVMHLTCSPFTTDTVTVDSACPKSKTGKRQMINIKLKDFIGW